MNKLMFRLKNSQFARLILTSALALSGVFYNVSAVPVFADQIPASCNASGLQQFPSIAPGGSVHDGDVITYSVIYINSDPDGAGPTAPCDITGANATIDLPGAAPTINVLTNASLSVGSTISCPGDAACAAGPYTYVVSHADEIASSVTAEFDILGVLHQDADEEAASDHDTLSKTVIHPTTITSISSSALQIVAGGTVNLTVTEQNDGDSNLTGAHVDVDNGVGTLSAPPTSGDDGDGILEPGETWSWTVSNVVVNADTTFTAIGHGTDSTGLDITFPTDQDERDSVSVDTIRPTTITSISSSASSVVSGGTVTLTVTEQNDGDVNLTAAHVDVDNGVGTLSAPPTSGDDGDGILEPGETWSWTVPGVVINSDTTFTATGHGTDPLGNDVTFPADREEQDAVTVTVLRPTTITSITSSAAMVITGGSVTLTVTEQNDGDANLTGAHVDVDNGVGTLSAPPTAGDDGDGILEPGETWSWTVNNVVVNADTTFTATGHGTDPAGTDITYPLDQDERDSVTVDAIRPTTVTAISSSASEVTEGGTVTLTITENNDGDVDLTNPHVVVDQGIGTLDETSASFTGVDGGDIGVLDPGETWTWVLTSPAINADMTFTATGHGTDPLGNDVTYPADQDERDSVTVTVIPLGCTLTQGYWKTHSSYGPAAHPDDTWLDLPGGLGPNTVFYSSGKTWIQVFNISPSGNAYYNLAHQYMAAKLNILSGASAPASVTSAISQAEVLFASHTPATVGAWKGNQGQRQLFISLAGTLGSYNEGLIGPGHCEDDQIN